MRAINIATRAACLTRVYCVCVVVLCCFYCFRHTAPYTITWGDCDASTHVRSFWVVLTNWKSDERSLQARAVAHHNIANCEWIFHARVEAGIRVRNGCRIDMGMNGGMWWVETHNRCLVRWARAVRGKAVHVFFASIVRNQMGWIVCSREYYMLCVCVRTACLAKEKHVVDVGKRVLVKRIPFRTPEVRVMYCSWMKPNKIRMYPCTAYAHMDGFGEFSPW